MRTLCLLLGGLLVFGATAATAKPKAKGKPAETKPAEIVKEGRIMIVRGLEGGEPQLTAEASERWLLVGPLRDELLRLEGHKLKVWGAVGDKKLMMQTLTVNRYELVDAGGGRRPVVGLLRKEADGSFTLERKEGALEVKGNKAFLDELAKRVGCKVWMVGDLEGKVLQAFKFGWISCKSPKSIKTGKETKR